jgi:hypothetical protein
MDGFVDIDQLLKYQISCPDVIICQYNLSHYMRYLLNLSFKIQKIVRGGRIFLYSSLLTNFSNDCKKCIVA